MKLDRNTNADGQGKYALIKLRVGQPMDASEIGPDVCCVPKAAIDFGDTPETEFFVIRYKDRFAARALHAYADAVKDYAKWVSHTAKDADRADVDVAVKELTEYADDIMREWLKANLIGTRIPD